MQNEDYRVINDDLTIFEIDVFYVKNVLRFYFLHAEQLWEECKGLNFNGEIPLIYKLMEPHTSRYVM